MFNCPNCGKELAEGTAFCDNCGTAISAAPAAETVFCANCGTQTDASSEFCQNCGAALNTEAAPAPAKKKVPAKLIGIAAAAVAAVALIIVLIAVIFGGGKKDIALYLKDDEIWINNFAKNGKFEVTSKLIDIDGYEANADVAENLSSMVVLSKDNKTLFYPDKVDQDGMTLYYRNITKKDSEAVKVDSGVENYFISKDAKVVTYIKNREYKEEEGFTTYDLYQYDMKKQDKAKVAGDVKNFSVAKDGKTLFFIDDENDLFIKKVGDDKIKLASDVKNIVGIAKNGKTVYYRTFEKIEKKDENGDIIESYEEYDLFKRQISKEENESIAKDVKSVFYVSEKDVLYYVTSEAKKVPATNFVEDNIKDDEDISEQWKEHYTEIWNDLKGAKVEIDEQTLFFYDGKGSVKVVEQYRDYWNRAADAAVVLVEHGGTYEKIISLSSMSDNLEDNIKRIENYGYYPVEDATFSVVVEKAVSKLDVEDVDRSAISDDGKLLYILTGVEYEKEAAEQPEGVDEPVMENIPEYKQVGDLIQVKIGKKAKLEVNAKFDTDVSALYRTPFGFYGEDDDMFVYAKDVDDNEELSDSKRTYTLFVDGKEVESDVWAVEGYYEELKGLLFVTDKKFEAEEEGGSMKYYSLKLYNGKKVQKVADEIYDFFVMPSGKILYLYDFNLEKGQGELYSIKVGKKAEKLDEDVVGILKFAYLVDMYK